MNQVLHGGRDAAQNTHDKLQIDGFFGDPFLNQVSQVVNHAGVVNFKFRFGSGFVENGQKLLHGFKGVRKDEIVGALQILFFPIKFPLFDFVDDMKEGKVQRAGIKGCQFGLERRCHGYPFFNRFPQLAAGGGAQNDVTIFFDFGCDFSINVLIRVGQSGFLISDMQMDRRSAGSMYRQYLIDQLTGGYRQVVRHTGRMNGAGQCGGDNCFFHEVHSFLN